MDHCLLEPEQMESGIRLGVTQAQEGIFEIENGADNSAENEVVA